MAVQLFARRLLARETRENIIFRCSCVRAPPHNATEPLTTQEECGTLTAGITTPCCALRGTHLGCDYPRSDLQRSRWPLRGHRPTLLLPRRSILPRRPRQRSGNGCAWSGGLLKKPRPTKRATTLPQRLPAPSPRARSVGWLWTSMRQCEVAWPQRAPHPRPIGGSTRRAAHRR